MGATYLHDPGAKARSPMLRQLTLCNGQKEGYECKHYWRQTVRKDTLNPDNLRKGETFRYCKLAMVAPDHNMAMFIHGDAEMAVECTEYCKDKKRPYDPDIDDYNPLTPEEIQALQEGRAVPRFQPKKWWQFWRKKPSVIVEYLTPEELAAEAQKVLERATQTKDAEGPSVLTGDVLSGGALSDRPAEEAPPAQEASPAQPPAESDVKGNQ